jgi:aminoglycoside/choline kinase family phosphotransferase
MVGPVLAGSSEQEFLRWFDLIGVQRHLKVLGIFARLWYRDGKSGYLADLPRTLDYVREAARLYPELHALDDWMTRRVVPQFADANARALASSAA